MTGRRIAVKTAELTGAALNWAVAVCEFEGCEDWDRTLSGVDAVSDMGGGVYSPSTDWSQGGPIIEREGISVLFASEGTWGARTNTSERDRYGSTPLIAAMRCYVWSQLGDDVELPEGLVG
jgi:hypothetical protein